MSPLQRCCHLNNDMNNKRLCLKNKGKNFIYTCWNIPTFLSHLKCTPIQTNFPLETCGCETCIPLPLEIRNLWEPNQGCQLIKKIVYHGELFQDLVTLFRFIKNQSLHKHCVFEVFWNSTKGHNDTTTLAWYLGV